ncbi:hypothetical protein M427DRAFT_383223 [Gonapodya prolifera JEL478]|uniref:Uncharacterized protein n=1 Tax=Gonapodya prolifera (strain JEL478) TaxID=1344416 RepID=A0A139A9R4_GONPJ|nr:hypothetical protein M427DRAFT_383223 [Gonapodya prolifera JEL478]|eukprot:KXS13143.1 hypothetical protein M427DRAFT_383223 [Gonapodya prolifera JEL478]
MNVGPSYTADEMKRYARPGDDFALVPASRRAIDPRTADPCDAPPARRYVEDHAPVAERAYVPARGEPPRPSYAARVPEVSEASYAKPIYERAPVPQERAYEAPKKVDPRDLGWEKPRRQVVAEDARAIEDERPVRRVVDREEDAPVRRAPARDDDRMPLRRAPEPEDEYAPRRAPRTYDEPSYAPRAPPATAERIPARSAWEDAGPLAREEPAPRGFGREVAERPSGRWEEERREGVAPVRRESDPSRAAGQGMFGFGDGSAGGGGGPPKRDVGQGWGEQRPLDAKWPGEAETYRPTRGVPEESHEPAGDWGGAKRQDGYGGDRPRDVEGAGRGMVGGAGWGAEDPPAPPRKVPSAWDAGDVVTAAAPRAAPGGGWGEPGQTRAEPQVKTAGWGEPVKTRTEPPVKAPGGGAPEQSRVSDLAEPSGCGEPEQSLGPVAPTNATGWGAPEPTTRADSRGGWGKPAQPTTDPSGTSEGEEPKWKGAGPQDDVDAEPHAGPLPEEEVPYVEPNWFSKKDRWEVAEGERYGEKNEAIEEELYKDKRLRGIEFKDYGGIQVEVRAAHKDNPIPGAIKI